MIVGGCSDVVLDVEENEVAIVIAVLAIVTFVEAVFVGAY